MKHKPLILKDISFYSGERICFENVNLQIAARQKIAIIGRNGSGKSTLLNIMRGAIQPSYGEVVRPQDLSCGYVPQVVEEFDQLSGGQRFNEALTKVLSSHPQILFLDEPTNHLDSANRASLMRMLKSYDGTLVVVSHDVELLRTVIDTLWHIEEGTIITFSGTYDQYLRHQHIARAQRLENLKRLKAEASKIREAAQKELQREAKSRRSGQKENDKNLRGKMKETGSHTAGKNKGKLGGIAAKVSQELLGLYIPEMVLPTFSLTSSQIGVKSVVSVNDGWCGYGSTAPVLKNIFFSVGATDRVALVGDNGAGKSTLIKALLGDTSIQKGGEWQVVKPTEYGYLDQQYRTLTSDLSVIETIKRVLSTATHADIRRHLNNFLFRKNEEVVRLVKDLSGGEKARLTLALIAARTPRLLILDEMTNNIDLETREHVITLLRAFPGALLLISHDADFLKEVGVTDYYAVANGTVLRVL